MEYGMRWNWREKMCVCNRGDTFRCGLDNFWRFYLVIRFIIIVCMAGAEGVNLSFVES